MIITTAGRVTPQLIQYAQRLSANYQIQYIKRNGYSIQQLKDYHQTDIFVAGKDRLFVSSLNDKNNLFFHPNLAMVRAKRLLRKEEDPFVATAKLEKGMSVLDCTVGLASDSIIASLAVGSNGFVTGLEGSKVIYIITNEGLKTCNSTNEIFNKAMRRIKIEHVPHLEYLKQQETNAYDVVYFDPMFHEAIDTSEGLNSMRVHALADEPTIEALEEAKRIARKRVVLKDHWKSDRFSRYGFTQIKRKSSLFHYGVIELH
ncbi:Putative SAM-dependent methyltransferase [Gracilibacillus orientalis]|uniref:Putative SAM-dependent methyltransferase n=1 Tax=Gracilibacillus orientalis TaxID=334253 RepID=A0A1I4L7T1_9BACI|nr:class I SAM-dependent methyltransferase [Gracilibacillus orientalis]SFL87088.1 Putative SAM-dependent methyltransferase [Gracilibacillus orientalis]